MTKMVTFDDVVNLFERQITPNLIGGESYLRNLQKTLNGAVDKYPPYNVERLDNESYNISIALAGFSKDDIAVTQEKNVLNIKAKAEPDSDKEYIYRGIAKRSFDKSFTLAEYIKVGQVSMVDGMLNVTLKREVPKEDQPKKFKIS